MEADLLMIMEGDGRCPVVAWYRSSVHRLIPQLLRHARIGVDRHSSERNEWPFASSCTVLQGPSLHLRLARVLYSLARPESTRNEREVGRPS